MTTPTVEIIGTVGAVVFVHRGDTTVFTGTGMAPTGGGVILMAGAVGTSIAGVSGKVRVSGGEFPSGPHLLHGLRGGNLLQPLFGHSRSSLIMGRVETW